MFRGILFVLAACFIWGMIFIIPAFMAGFSPIEVALTRYFFYGLISFSIVFTTGKLSLLRLPAAVWLKAFQFALITNIIYYIMLVLGTRYASPAVAALIFGTSPILIAFYGNWCEGETNFRSLLLPAFLIACGLILVNWRAFEGGNSDLSFGAYLFGLFCSFGAVGAWTWYCAANARFMKQHPTLRPSDWSTVVGMATFGWVMVIAVMLGLFYASHEDIQKYTPSHDLFSRFLIGGLVLGVACSWVGFYLWNRATALLPVSLAGQLTVFETIFGLIFVYTFEQRLPTVFEMAGVIIILSGIVLSLKSYKHAPASA